MVLSPLHSAWMAQLLGGPVPVETAATCHSCAMCPPMDEPAASVHTRYYTPETKCCTFWPEIPNFLIGTILELDLPGRITVEARIAAREAVTPLGLGRPSLQRAQLRQDKNAFGRDAALVCPHFLSEGRCGIWGHACAVCSTWFCKYSRGAVGLRFWTALRGLLSSVEKGLAYWCLEQLDVRTPVPDRGDGPPGSAWGAWSGREPEFYRRCAACVQNLDWSAVREICGPETDLLADLVRDAYQELGSSDLPKHARTSTFTVQKIEGDAWQVSAYNPLDPIRLPRALVGVLHFFDGGPLDEALRACETEGRVRVDRAVVRRLLDHEILLPADGAQQ